MLAAPADRKARVQNAQRQNRGGQNPVQVRAAENQDLRKKHSRDVHRRNHQGEHAEKQQNRHGFKEDHSGRAVVPKVPQRPGDPFPLEDHMCKETREEDDAQPLMHDVSRKHEEHLEHKAQEHHAVGDDPRKFRFRDSFFPHSLPPPGAPAPV